MFSNARDAFTPRRQSVYERVLGERFAALDPQLREYFGFLPEGSRGVGVGTYTSAGLRMRMLWPVFVLLGWRGVAFPKREELVPFVIENAAHADGSLSARRTFFFGSSTRMMVDSMRVDDELLIDRVGRRGEFEVHLALSVVDGRLRMTSQRLALRLGRLRVPLPAWATLVLEESAAAPGDRCQHVELTVNAPVVGEIYGYSGAFTYERRTLTRRGAG
ncbi:DUF4166 domain-containing protein [Microbacterium sp. LRZ72]|uniref:DUF4166 domain-containing protein n=1 Tax=Microbacterium sp. LRZ72 TaxID=2942481 RepID=UPI0029BE0448|nr:DUF4166 domain-containing protein [Microbacterium sp. LRZ72]MDX2377890.1 DUF4166 domain-containing protein [Microbacterium sp. LRZ72]